MRAWWENKGTSVEISKKTQKRIAIICSLVLAGVLLAVAARALHPAITDWLNQRQQSTTSEKPTNETPAKNGQADSDKTDKETSDDQPASSSKTDAKESSVAYSYTATAGDSYTAFARDAIQQYIAQQNTPISASQALNAEVALANAAGSPLLEIGDVVTIAQADVATVLGTKADATTNNKDGGSKDSEAPYSYTAVSGDNYTTLARTAVQAYATKHSLNLNSAQRVAAETQLAAAANWPQIDVAQHITFDTKTLQTVTETVRNLTADQQAAWQPYASLAGL